MADYARVGYYGWDQGDDSADVSRVTSIGWEQVDAVSTPATGIPKTTKLTLLGVG